MDAKDNIILQIKNLNFAYSKNHDFALKDVNLDFKQGKVYSILGQNGCGKSTLLHTISSILKKYTGKIIYENAGKKTEIKNLKNNQRAKIISLVPQQSIGNSLNVYDTVMLGRKPYINISPMMVDHEMTSRAIDTFKLNRLTLKSTNELSGGELQNVSIARAFAQNCPIMLLDEPTNNLDVKKQHNVFEILKKQAAEKKLTVICVLHDINHAIKYADELIFMKNGQVIANGNSNIVNEKLLKEIYDVNAKIFKEGYILI